MKIKDRAKPAVPPVAPGPYYAVCVYSIDLGEQSGKDRNGQTYCSNKVRLGFELAGETVEIGGKTEPRILGRTFPVSRAKNSGLRKFIEAWRGKVFTDEEFGDFDTNKLVGFPAQLGVILNDTGEYANINTIMQLPKGVPAPTHTAPLIRYDMEPWSEEAFKSLPEWAQEQIKKSTQYQKLHPPTNAIDFAAQSAPAAQPAAVAHATPFDASFPSGGGDTPAAANGVRTAPVAPGAANPNAYQVSAQAENSDERWPFS